jgi:SOS-response transcriptional repressor LexA
LKTKRTTTREWLTAHERKGQVLAFVLRHVQANGYPPTIRGTAKGIGVSTTRAQQLFEALVEEGIVGHKPGMARTYTVDRDAAARYLDRP